MRDGEKAARSKASFNSVFAESKHEFNSPLSKGGALNVLERLKKFVSFVERGKPLLESEFLDVNAPVELELTSMKNSRFSVLKTYLVV